MMEYTDCGSHDDACHWNCFAQLLPRPHRGVRGDVDLQDTSAFVGEDDEDEQHATRKGRHGEEVERHTRADVISEEGAPRLGRRPTPTRHQPGRRSLRHRETELDELAVHPGAAADRTRPPGFFERHLAGWPRKVWVSFESRPLLAMITGRVRLGPHL